MLVIDKREGLMREIVNKLNTMRRDAGFEVTDRIEVKIDSTDKVKKCFEQYGSYIQEEVLAVSVDFASNGGTDWDLNGEAAKIEVKRVEI